MISVQLNGEVCQLEAPLTLEAALLHWQQQNRIGAQYAVAINNEFIPRSAYGVVTLNAGDLIDIVQPVGGG